MMKKRYILPALLSMVFQFATAAEEIEPTKELVYKEAKEGELKLHVFEPEVASDQKRAAMVYFFGGGWRSGTPRQFYQQAHDMAKLGVVGIAVEYRVMGKHKVTPFQCVEDAKSAIRWVRQNAEKLHIDPDKIIASGGSAGGHLAVCTGVIQGGDTKGEDLSVSSVPNAVVAYNPVLDTTDKGYGLEKVGVDRSHDISPCHQVRPGMVPTIIFHGTADTTVPFENAERFVSLMKEAGNDAVLKAYEGKGHGFFNAQFFRPKMKSSEIYDSTHKETVEFLQRLDFVEEK